MNEKYENARAVRKKYRRIFNLSLFILTYYTADRNSDLCDDQNFGLQF